VNGPGVGQAVQVITGNGATIGARVKDNSRGGFLLRLSDGAGGDPLELLEDKAVSLEFTNLRGICRILGQAAPAVGESVLRIEPTGTIELIQRRDYVRVEAFVPVTYLPDGPDGWTASAHTLDVSGGGFQITDAEGLRHRDIRRFTLDLGEGEEPVSAVAEAVRVVDEETFGLRFVEILESERQRLVRWVFARERLARQIARHP
jgi:hypothetical protein